MKTWRFIQIVLMWFLLMEVSTPNITTAQSLLPLEQDPWDTYIDNEYGFSIQYPSGWRIEKSVPQVQAPHIRQIRIYFIGPDQATIAVDVWAAHGYAKVLDWFNTTQQPRIVEKTIDGGYPLRTNAVLQSAPAIFFVQPPGEQVPLAYRTYVLAQQRVYLIHYSAFDHGAALETYQKMLESLTIYGQRSKHNEIPIMPPAANYGEIRQPGCAGNSIFACTAIYYQGCCGYPAGSNGFPCAREGSTDKGNCTWWAAHVWPELGQDVINSPYRGCYSGGGANASEWLCIAQNEGYSTGHTQEVGAIFWPQPGTHGTGTAGHVAAVIQTGTSTFKVSEMNWCYTCYRENTYSYLATDMFIYHRIDSIPPTTAHALSGAAGENGWYTAGVQVTLSASDNSGGSGIKLTQYRVDGGGWQTYGGPFTVSGNGSHTVYYQSQDNANNWETEKSVSFSIDTTAPAAPTTAAAGCTAVHNTWQHTCADPIFTFSGASDATSGIAGYQLYWGSDPNGTSDYWTGSTTFDPGAPGEGTYYFRARAKDNAGNWSGWVTLFVFRYDGTAPAAPTSAASGCAAIHNLWQNSCADPIFTCSGASDATSGIAGYQLYWGSDPNGTSDYWTGSPTFDPGAPGEGTYYFRARAKDNAGNWSGWVTLFTFRYDATAPTGSLALNNGDTVTYATLVRLATTAADAHSGVWDVRFRDVNGTWSDWQPYTPNLYWQLPGPTGQTLGVEVQYRDRAGNISSVYRDTIALNLYPARPASPNYRLARSTFGASGATRTSSNYKVWSTLGQPAPIGSMQSTGYRMVSGYWARLEAAQYAVYLPLVIRQ